MKFEYRFKVKEEWLDANGHMNMGYYLVAFDMYGTDLFFEELGIGLSYIKRTQKTTFTLAANIDYLREAFAGEELLIRTQILDWDYKRLHYFHEMSHAEKAYLIATNECLTMHMNLQTRKSEAFAKDFQQKLAQIAAEHAKRPTPEQAYRKMGIRRA
ncbi:MAG: thioesterase family protein [Deinococcales bacterium]